MALRLALGTVMLVLERHGLGKVGLGVVLVNLVFARRSGFNHSDVVTFTRNGDLDTHGTLGIRIAVLLKVHTDDSVDLVNVLVILLQEVLDVLVLGQGELGEGQHGRVEFQNVE